MKEYRYRIEWAENPDAPFIFKAIEFSAKAHEGQFRKGLKVPYVYHPMDVGRILMDMGCPADIVVAGLLHDTVEDTDVTVADIREHFGDKVAILVEEASEPEGIETWEARKAHTIERLKTVSNDALCVICADKFDNVRSIRLELEKTGSVLWESFARPADKQLWYYKSIAEALEERVSDGPLLSLFERYKREINRAFSHVE